MQTSLMRGIGEYITSRHSDIIAVTAGGSGDNTEATGAWIDRQDFESAKMVISFSATLGQDETLTIAANARDASDSSGTGAADFGDAHAAAVAATGGTGGSTETGTVELDFDLNTADQYIQSQVTPDLSRANTDTATIHVIWILGGARELPAA